MNNTDKRVLELYEEAKNEIEKIVIKHAEKIVSFTKENNIPNTDHVVFGTKLGYGDDLSLTAQRLSASVMFKSMNLN
jgi:hypothetical protein